MRFHPFSDKVKAAWNGLAPNWSALTGMRPGSGKDRNGSKSKVIDLSINKDRDSRMCNITHETVKKEVAFWLSGFDPAATLRDRREFLPKASGPTLAELTESVRKEKPGTPWEQAREIASRRSRLEQKEPPAFEKARPGTFALEKTGMTDTDEIATLRILPIADLELREEAKRGPVVEKYIGWMRDGHEPPPLFGVVIYSEKGERTVRVSDGHHRVAAALAVGRTEIPVWCCLTDPEDRTRGMTPRRAAELYALFGAVIKREFAAASDSTESFHKARHVSA